MTEGKRELPEKPPAPPAPPKMKSIFVGDIPQKLMEEMTKELYKQKGIEQLLNKLVLKSQNSQQRTQEHNKKLFKALHLEDDATRRYTIDFNRACLMEVVPDDNDGLTETGREPSQPETQNLPTEKRMTSEEVTTPTHEGGLTDVNDSGEDEECDPGEDDELDNGEESYHPTEEL